MNFNIVTAIQEKMGFEPFEKMDPNYRADRPGFPTNNPGSDNYSSHYAQAATMAVLAGLYRYGSDREGATDLATTVEPASGNLLTRIFKGQEKIINREVAAYLPEKSGVRNKFPGDTIQFMQEILGEAVGILKKQAGNGEDEAMQIQKLLPAQRHNILAYLPAEIMAGKVLKDNSMDDRTNKMEGPVSGLMHFIENVFAEKE